jgi:hypothetical protein
MTPERRDPDARERWEDRMEAKVDRLLLIVCGDGDEKPGQSGRIRRLEWQVKFIGLVVAAVAIEALRSLSALIGRGGGQ